MKTFTHSLALLSVLNCLGLLSPLALSQPTPRPAPILSRGGESGGGGEAFEIPFENARLALIRWIASGGARNLELPQGISHELYRTKMLAFLNMTSGSDPQVIVGFVTLEEQRQTSDPEHQVFVEGEPKTCRWFRSQQDSRIHILCLIERFMATPPDGIVALVHHEFAGIAGIEQNVGASSDYFVSRQISIPGAAQISFGSSSTAAIGTSSSSSPITASTPDPRQWNADGTEGTLVFAQRCGPVIPGNSPLSATPTSPGETELWCGRAVYYRENFYTPENGCANADECVEWASTQNQYEERNAQARLLNLCKINFGDAFRPIRSVTFSNRNSRFVHPTETAEDFVHPTPQSIPIPPWANWSPTFSHPLSSDRRYPIVTESTFLSSITCRR